MLLNHFALSQKSIKITQFDIGQGDATLVQSFVSKNSTINVLFDAGGYNIMSGEDAGAVIYDYLKSNDVDRLDYIIVSHYDADHIGGLVSQGWNGMYGISLIEGPDNTITRDDIKVMKIIDRGDSNAPSSTIFERYQSYANTKYRISIDSAYEMGTKITLGPNAYMQCIASNGYVNGKTNRVENVATENDGVCLLF